MNANALERVVHWLDRERADWQNRWLTSERASQGTFLGFVEQAQLREESVPQQPGQGGRTCGEIVYYNLGKFSQPITDYEPIHYHSDAASLYAGFAGFLRHQAADYYPGAWEDAGYAAPDAVQIMTVHQAKGMGLLSMAAQTRASSVNCAVDRRAKGHRRQPHDPLPVDPAETAARSRCTSGSFIA